MFMKMEEEKKDVTTETNEYETQYMNQNFKLPEMDPSPKRSPLPAKFGSPRKSVISNLDEIKLPDIPADQLGRSLQA